MKCLLPRHPQPAVVGMFKIYFETIGITVVIVIMNSTSIVREFPCGFAAQLCESRATASEQRVG